MASLQAQWQDRLVFLRTGEQVQVTHLYLRRRAGVVTAPMVEVSHRGLLLRDALSPEDDLLLQQAVREASPPEGEVGQGFLTWR